MTDGPIEVIDVSDSDTDCEDDVFVLSMSGDNGKNELETKNPNSSCILTQEDVTATDDRIFRDGPSIIENSFEDFDYNLKLMRYGNFELYKTTCCTKLSVALKDLISELDKSGKTLVLSRREEIEEIPLDATPQQLNLDSGTILNAIVVNKKQQETKISNCTTKQPNNPNIITLKLQDGQMRHLKEYKIAKQEPLSQLKERYAKEFNIELSKMKLSFDGDHVDDNSTPEDLDIEDECVIDVVVDP